MMDDIVVLELASVLAGPSVGQFFAELGAQVIKVENSKTQGDITRTWKGLDEKTDDRSAYFCSVNWGKKSIALDLTCAEDRVIVEKLAARSDIVIVSYKPGDAEKLGVSYEQLRINNPKLIYGQITGYGSDNDRVGYDAVVQAESGFIDLNGNSSGEGIKMPVALVDILSAHHLKEGLLIALLKRDRTGEGSRVEISLIQAAISSLANQATNWLVAKKLPKRQGSAHPNIAPYGESFITKDEKRILLAVGSDRQFADLLKVLKLETLNGNDMFSTNHSRVIHRDELSRQLSKAIRQFDSIELMAKINAYKIPAGVIQNMKEVFEMSEAVELLISNNELKGVRNFASKISGFEKPLVDLLPPPHFGEHSDEILSGINQI